METVNYQKFIGTWGLRIFLKNGTLHRFKGFKESDQEKIAKFFSVNYKKDMLEKELSLKGWNWGTARFNGSVLSFDVGHHTAFEIPLYDVSQCNTGKNEVTLEFHQNDDAPVSLMEMRFHIPVSDSADQDPVEAFHQQVRDLDNKCIYNFICRLKTENKKVIHFLITTGDGQGICYQCKRRRDCHIQRNSLFNAAWSLRHQDLSVLLSIARQNFRL